MKKLISICFLLIFGFSACSSINNISKDSVNRNEDKEKISLNDDQKNEVEEKKDVMEEKKGVVEKDEKAEEDRSKELDEEEMKKNVAEWQNNITNKPCNPVPEEKKLGYQIWDDCFYKDNKLVFEHNLVYEIVQNGDEEYKNFVETKKWGDGAGEWLRLQVNNNLRIFLASNGGCGGCIYTGVYLDINLSNNKIEMKFADLPYSGNTIFSPDNHYAFYINVSHFYKGTTDIMLYDFSELKNKGVIYTIPENLSIQQCGDGCYMYKEDAFWLDNYRIQLNLLIRGESGVVMPDEIKYVDEPTIIDIQKFL